MRGQVAQDGTGSPHALAEPDGARRTAHLSAQDGTGSPHALAEPDGARRTAHLSRITITSDGGN